MEVLTAMERLRERFDVVPCVSPWAYERIQC